MKQNLYKELHEYFIKLENFLNFQINCEIFDIDNIKFKKKFLQKFWFENYFLRYASQLDYKNIEKCKLFKNNSLHLILGKINKLDGKLSFNFSKFIYFFIKYIFYLSYIFLNILISFFYKKKNSIYVVLHVPLLRVNLKSVLNEYYKYFNNLEHLDSKDNCKFIINSNIKKCNQFIYSNNYLNYIMRNSLGFKSTFSILINFLKVNVYFLCKVTKNPELIILYKDILDSIIAKELNKSNLLASVVFTSSYYDDQPLWINMKSKNFKTLFIWDSASIFYNLNFLDFEISTPFHLEYISCDFHYVSSKHHKIIAKKIFKNSEVIIVKNFFRSFKKIKKNKKFKVVSLFPVNILNFKPDKVFGSNYSNYYNEKNIINFFYDILEVVEEFNKNKDVSIKLIIKFKNNNKFFNNILYKLKKNFPFVKIINHNIDTISLCNYSDLVISMPITSPTFFDSSFNSREAIFYDPSYKIIDSIGIENILFIQGKENIKKIISKI